MDELRPGGDGDDGGWGDPGGDDWGDPGDWRRGEGPGPDLAEWRRGAYGVALASALVAVALFPPVAGLLLSADGAVDEGIRLTLITLASGALLAFAGVVAAVASWPRALAWVVRRRHWLLAAATLAVVATSGWLLQRLVAAEAPPWQDAVDLADPALSAVKARLAAGDADGAEAALVAAFAAHDPGPGPLSPWLETIDPVEARRAAAALAQRQLVVGDDSIAWPADGALPWSELTPGQLVAIERGDPLLAALAGVRLGTAPEAAEHARAFFVHWADARFRHRSWPGADGGAWGDDATANRMMTLLCWLEALHRGPQKLGADDARALLRLLLRHRQALLSRRAAGAGERALTQDAALIALATAYPFLDPGRQIHTMARQRHARFLVDRFSVEGVARDLSPSVHCQQAALLAWHLALRAGRGERVEASEARMVAGMIDFARRIQHPDGGLPPIADTAQEHRCDEVARLDLPPSVAAAAGRATASGDASASGAFAWPGAGYVVFRVDPATSAAGASDEPLPLFATLMTGPASQPHRHADKLALTLFAAGRSLLGGPGYVARDDPRAHDKLGSAGQSAVHLDGGAQQAADATLVHLASDVSASGSDGDPPLRAAIAVGALRLADGAVLHRALVYGATAATVLVIDTVEADAPRYIAVHERAQDNPAGHPRGDLLWLSWRGTPAASLQVRRWVRIDGGEVVALAVRWRPPMAWSELRASRAELATLLTPRRGGTAERALGGRGVSFGSLRLRGGDDGPAREDEAGSVRWEGDWIVWQGPRGVWRLPRRLERGAEARFVAAGATVAPATAAPTSP